MRTHLLTLLALMATIAALAAPHGAEAAPAAPAIASPAAGSIVAGTVGVVARAGSVQGAANVELAVDGARVGSATAPPWGILWDTRGAAEGAHELRLTAVGADGARTASPPIRVTVQNGAGGGLEASYFNGSDLSDPATTRVDPSVEFNWGRGRPVPGMPADGFSVRWAGSVQAPSTDSYTFAVDAEDGVRVWVGGTLLIDAWDAQGVHQHTGKVALVAGTRYPLRIEYLATDGDAHIRLRWKSFHTAMTSIPQRLLRPERGASVRTSGLRATFFGRRTLRSADRLTSRVDSVLSFDWGNGAPARGVPSDNFSARWSGTLRAPKAGRYRFWATADDGVRLQVGAKRVLLDWHEHAAKTTSGVVVLRRGVRSPIRLDYYEAGGGAVMRLEWQPPGGKRGPIPASLLTPDPAPAKPAPPTTGLVGTYYDETNMTRPIVQRLDPEVRFDWNRAQPDPEMYPDTYSVRWTGSVTAPVTGAYRLATRADDGTRLFVDGQPIVDDWTVHGARWKEGVVQLEAGHSYDIELQYYQGNGGAEVQLAWTPPGGARTVIPTQYLAPRPPSPEPMTQPVPAPPAVPEPGLWGVYHDEEDFTGRMYGRTDAQLAMHWKGQPHPSIDRDTFSVRWTGSLAVPLVGDYRLVTDADDGVRVWLDGQPLIDRWTWRSPSVDRSAAVHLVPGRRYDLRVDQHDGSGDAGIELRWTSARIPEQPIPTWALMTPGAVAGELALPDAPEPFAVTDDQLAQPGLLGLYWDDLAYLQPKLARVDPTVDGRWGTASPAPGMGRDEFAVRWLGSVVAPRAGAWRFHVTADDGLRLWVCGRLVLDAWKVQGASEYTSEPVNLTPGAPCAVRLDYFEQGGEASVKLAWSAADQPKQVIPATALRPPTRAELGPLWWWAGT